MSRTTTTDADTVRRRAESRDVRHRSAGRITTPGRRAMMAGAIVLLLAAIVIANQGPVRELLRERAQLAAKERQVAEIEKGNEAYKAEIARLEKSSYLEALARKQLAYAKPGEDVFIVQGLPPTASLPGSEVTPSVQAAREAGSTSGDGGSTSAAADASSAPVTGGSDAPSGAGPAQGWLGRLLSAVRGLL